MSTGETDHTTVTVTADVVEYFSDAAALQARGHVRLSLPDGVDVEGDVFSMELSLRRLVVAGHVTMRRPDAVLSGAAFADFLAYHRMYFIPLEPTADRWTYLNGDYRHPEMGRTMPGDAFFIPDLTSTRPYVLAKAATIDSTTFVKFSAARVAVENGPRTPPLPSFVYNFAQNPDFSINALSGATFDAPYAFAGSASSLDAVHLRYNQQEPVKTYLSFEHHSVGDDRSYAVFSLNPATEYDKQWNLYTYDGAGQSTALALNAQLFTAQHGITQPSVANGFADFQIVHALRESSLRFDLTQSYDSLLPGSGVANHPVIAGLAWTGYDESLGHSGFTYRVQSGLATAHDVFGVSGSSLTDVWARYVTATLSSPSFRGPFDSSLNATFQASRIWADFPNEVRWNTATISAGKQLATKLYGVASAVVGTVSADNLSGVLVSPNLTTGFSAQPSSSNGLPFFGAPTVFAHTTARSYLLALAWQPSTAFQLGASVQKSVYSPVQVTPPYQAAVAVRTSLTRNIFATIGRSYSFNWQGQRWSPQFTLQLTQQ